MDSESHLSESFNRLLWIQLYIIKENSHSHRAPSKLLCFTRSSTLVHELPPFHDGIESSHSELLQIALWPPKKLVICKLTNTVSQAKLQDVLKNFASSMIHEVLIVIVDMQQTSIQVVNHLRIMMEEVENGSSPSGNPEKITVLLLHFQPTMFFEPCYPSLFLQGWGHYYLDTIVPGTVEGSIDIKDWFECCYSSQQPHVPTSLQHVLRFLLQESVPVLSSRVVFTSNDCGCFNKAMSELERCTVLRTLFNEKEVGYILCDLFSSYWKPSVMRRHLERAATFTMKCESTLNLTDSIQTMFKSLFVEFLVYMVSAMNEGFGIDILFDDRCSVATKDMFYAILKAFPIPNLPDLKSLNKDCYRKLSTKKHQNVIKSKRLPFFMLIYEELDRMIKESGKEIGLHSELEFSGLQDPQSKYAEFKAQTSQQRSTILCNILERSVQSALQVSLFESASYMNVLVLIRVIK